MLEGENIICISWLNWDRLPLVMHHMMTRLSQKNFILFVDPAIAITTFLSHPSTSGFVWKKIWCWLNGVKKINENLYLYYPPPLFFQFGHFKINDRLNQLYLAYFVNKIAKHLKITSPILWLYDPYAINPTGQLGEKLVCFDCNDDISSFANLSYKKKKLISLEDKLVEKADIIFTTSRNLYYDKKQKNPHTYYFPSGVDLDLFQKALSPSCELPVEVKAIPKPIIGFIGAITNYRINWEWIQYLSTSRPEWSIVFIGPCLESPPRDIVSQKNILFLGKKEQEVLPGYLKAFDVCIIPYKGEEFLKSCQPTKTFEYLAAGKPVVSSDIHELREFQPLVKLCQNAEEFLTKITECFEEGLDPAIIEKRIEISKAYTWNARVEGTSFLIQQILDAKQK